MFLIEKHKYYKDVKSLYNTHLIKLQSEFQLVWADQNK